MLKVPSRAFLSISSTEIPVNKMKLASSEFSSTKPELSGGVSAYCVLSALYRSYECQPLGSVSLIKGLYYKHWYDVWPYHRD